MGKLEVLSFILAVIGVIYVVELFYYQEFSWGNWSSNKTWSFVIILASSVYFDWYYKNKYKNK